MTSAIVHEEVVRMPWDQIFMVGRVIFVSDETGWWKWVRMALLLGLVLFLLWLWLLKDTVTPIEHSMRESFGVIKFTYFDGLEATPERRLRWYQVKNDEQFRFWLKAKRTQWRNSRDAKAFRNSPDGNKPHELLRFGNPRIYGPGWYTTGPRDKAVRLIKLDTRNRVVNLTVFVRMDDAYEVFVLPIQLTIRIANLYLWMQACNDTEGGILGLAREKARAILKLGYDTIRDDADKVSEKLIEAMQGYSELNKGVQWYGGEIVFVNPATPEYQPVSMVADALRKASPPAIDELRATGSAVIASISTDDGAPTTPFNSAA